MQVVCWTASDTISCLSASHRNVHLGAGLGTLWASRFFSTTNNGARKFLLSISALHTHKLAWVLLTAAQCSVCKVTFHVIIELLNMADLNLPLHSPPLSCHPYYATFLAWSLSAGGPLTSWSQLKGDLFPLGSQKPFLSSCILWLEVPPQTLVLLLLPFSFLPFFLQNPHFSWYL